MSLHTSITHPLQIAEVRAPAAKGAIGVTFCPGKQQESAMSGAWRRDLGLDLDVIKAWGTSTIITLIEDREMRALNVEAIGSETVSRGMAWLHMPITDISAPDLRFEQAWSAHRTQLISDVRSGARVLVHCKGGLGRAGTVAALMLVDLGLLPDEAIRSVRAARSQHAIETHEQELYIREWMSRQNQFCHVHLADASRVD